ncbi:MAG TPA: MarR family winged helix-turn-helix transcriptional regulator [Caulobacteraceae bacterium]|jgi:DNA-binding MarR family transcriptional regulator
MPDLNSDAARREAIELFYFAYRAFTDGPDRILARRGLGRVHHRILYFVGGRPGITVGGLLAVLAVSKQALNAPLRQLGEMKLVEAIADEADRRVKRLRLTPEGQRLEAELTGVQERLLDTAFAGADAAGWHTVMQRLAAA